MNAHEWIGSSCRRRHGYSVIGFGYGYCSGLGGGTSFFDGTGVGKGR